MIIKKEKLYPRYGLIYYRKGGDRKNWCTYCEFFNRCQDTFLGCGEILGTLCFELPGLRDDDVCDLVNYIYIPEIK